jgi:hypothetical protein
VAQASRLCGTVAGETPALLRFSWFPGEPKAHVQLLGNGDCPSQLCWDTLFNQKKTFGRLIVKFD